MSNYLVRNRSWVYDLIDDKTDCETSVHVSVWDETQSKTYLMFAGNKLASRELFRHWDVWIYIQSNNTADIAIHYYTDDLNNEIPDNIGELAKTQKWMVCASSDNYFTVFFMANDILKRIESDAGIKLPRICTQGLYSPYAGCKSGKHCEPCVGELCDEEEENGNEDPCSRPDAD